jgi:hypothetical protein
MLSEAFGPIRSRYLIKSETKNRTKTKKKLNKQEIETETFWGLF